MKYKVIIEETISQEYEIDASSLKVAKEKAVEEYKNGKIILDSGEVQSKQIKVIDEKNNDTIDWEEF